MAALQRKEASLEQKEASDEEADKLRAATLYIQRAWQRYKERKLVLEQIRVAWTTCGSFRETGLAMRSGDYPSLFDALAEVRVQRRLGANWRLDEIRKPWPRLNAIDHWIARFGGWRRRGVQEAAALYIQGAWRRYKERKLVLEKVRVGWNGGTVQRCGCSLKRRASNGSSWCGSACSMLQWRWFFQLKRRGFSAEMWRWHKSKALPLAQIERWQQRWRVESRRRRKLWRLRWRAGEDESSGDSAGEDESSGE